MSFFIVKREEKYSAEAGLLLDPVRICVAAILLSGSNVNIFLTTNVKNEVIVRVFTCTYELSMSRVRGKELFSIDVSQIKQP